MPVMPAREAEMSGAVSSTLNLRSDKRLPAVFIILHGVVGRVTFLSCIPAKAGTD
jgi:hypothetical protein